MVASRHPSSRSAGSRAFVRTAGDAGRPPRLRLVVDNTAARWDAPGDPSRPVARAGREAARRGEQGPHAAVLAAWSAAWSAAPGRLVEARWRLVRQRLSNRHGRVLADRLVELAPAVGLTAVVVFGGLFALRVAQESASAGSVDGAMASVAAQAPAAAARSEVVFPMGDGVTGAEPAVVVVHPGDSLWSIATTRFPDRDPRQVVDAFVEVNGGSMISSGQQLIIPASLLED